MHLKSSLRQWFTLKAVNFSKFSLLQMLVRRDLEARYKGSMLGNLWPLLNQVSQLLIYTYVFSIVLRVKLPIQGQSPQAIMLASRGFNPDSTLLFGLWLFAALVPWIAFSTSVTQACNAVVGQTNLVKKVVFPLALLPIVPVLSALIESAFGLAVLILLLAFLTQNLPWQLSLLPAVWAMQAMLTAGLCYIVASLTVFIRDIAQSVGIILNLLFYLTPVVYGPEKLGSFEPWVMRLNPLATITALYRDLIFWGSTETLESYGLSLLITSSLVFILGKFIYKKLAPAFADVL